MRARVCACLFICVCANACIYGACAPHIAEDIYPDEEEYVI